MDACDTTLQAAQKAGSLPETITSIKNMMAEPGADSFVVKFVQRQIEAIQGSCAANTKIVQPGSNTIPMTASRLNRRLARAEFPGRRRGAFRQPLLGIETRPTLCALVAAPRP